MSSETKLSDSEMAKLKKGLLDIFNKNRGMNGFFTSDIGTRQQASIGVASILIDQHMLGNDAGKLTPEEMLELKEGLLEIFNRNDGIGAFSSDFARRQNASAQAASILLQIHMLNNK